MSRYTGTIITLITALLVILFSPCRLSGAGERFTFAVISDTHLARSNGAYAPYGQTGRIVENITKDIKPRFVLHCGDMISSWPDRNSEHDISRMWDVFKKACLRSFS